MYVPTRLTVFYPSLPFGGAGAALQERVGDVADVVWEGEPPDETSVLIEGRPRPELLQPLRGLRHVVVPFAGVPQETLQLMRQFPSVSLHNLHHNAPETAELAVSLLMAAAKMIVPHDQKLRKLDWSPRYAASRTVLLEGKTLLVLGYGEIGQRVARSARALGMDVVALRASASKIASDEVAEIYPRTALKDLLPRANAVVIALPLTPETTGMLGEAELALLPPNAILVNIARAKIVDEEALFRALSEGRLHSAGLDVWYQYPRESPDRGTSVPTYFEMPKSALETAPSQFPFHELENVVLSPHRGGTSMDTEPRRLEHLASLIRRLATGDGDANRVNLATGY